MTRKHWFLGSRVLSSSIYILGKEVFFQGQDNYIDLYRYLDDFLALYLMLNLCRQHAHNTTLIWQVNREHMDWGPAEQDPDLYKGFSIPTFTADVLSHDYHLHWDLGEITQDYCLPPFLHMGCIDSKPPPPLSAGHKCQCSDSNKRLFGPDSWEDELPSTGPTKSS